MEEKFVFAFLVFFVCLLQDGAMEKESEGEERLFRINKLNLIWRKAQHKMSQNKLNNLREALQTQDVEEMRLKKLKAVGKDEYGEEAAKLRASLLQILNKYGLSKYADNSNSRVNEAFDSKIRGKQFEDLRLDKLWDMAKEQFSKEELLDLKTEFNHHNDKQLEYDSLSKLLSKHEDISDNSVLKHNKLTPDKLEKLQDQVSTKQEDVRKNFARLKERVERGRKGNSPFDDSRVNDLWHKALKGGFSDEELTSIKEELEHFDHKIEKHEHFQEQAEKSRQMVADGHVHLKEKHEKLWKKAKEHGRWVKKMHKTMMDRVTREEL